MVVVVPATATNLQKMLNQLLKLGSIMLKTTKKEKTSLVEMVHFSIQKPNLNLFLRTFKNT